MRENHIVDDNPDNDINTPSLSKIDDDRKLDEKFMLKININKMQTRLKRWDIKVSQLHLIVALKRNISINDHDKLNGQKQIQRHRQIIIKKATSKLNKGRATNNNYSDILKNFWMMYWPKLVILMGIIILIVILNAILIM